MKQINEDKVQSVLSFIKDFQLKEGRSPSFRQIAKAMSFPSIATAQKYISVLQSRGLIRKTNVGKIAIPGNLATGKTIIAPVVGSIVCGPERYAEQNIEKTVRLPVEIFGSAETMILTAEGDSMINAGIQAGDLLVVKVCNTAENGNIVVARIGDSATLKRYYKKDGYFVLHPENPKYKDIITKELDIQGVLKYNIHSF